MELATPQAIRSSLPLPAVENNLRGERGMAGHLDRQVSPLRRDVSSDAGVVNIARYARRLTGDQSLHAMIGGFHLNGPLFAPLISRVLDDLAALQPSVLVPAHCTDMARPTRHVGALRSDFHPQQRRHHLSPMGTVIRPGP